MADQNASLYYQHIYVSRYFSWTFAEKAFALLQEVGYKYARNIIGILMITALLIFHSIFVLLLIAVVLFQKGESGGFVSSQNSMVSARGAKSFLTRTTGILAGLFFITSLGLAVLVKNHMNEKRNILAEAVSASDVIAPSKTEESVSIADQAPVQTTPTTPEEHVTAGAVAAESAPAPAHEKKKKRKKSPKKAGSKTTQPKAKKDL